MGEVHSIDARGLKCIAHTLKLTTLSFKLQSGDVIELLADCETFEKDVKEWCDRNRKVLLWIKAEDGNQRCQIQM